MSVTAFQTIGPYFGVLMRARVALEMVRPETKGNRIVIEGVLYDGEGVPIRDGLVELWQADAAGHYAHPEDPGHAAADPSFYGYGWRHTGGEGEFRFETVKPGRVAGPDGRLQAPHILVSVMARGILTRYITRLYFADEPSNAEDAILSLVPAARRETLVARPTGAGQYRFDIRFQGASETVFFDA